jgi:hypothetical protein
LKHRRKIGNIFQECAVLAVFLLGAAIVVLIHINPGFKLYSRAVNPFFILKPDAVTEEIISDYAGIRRTYTFTLPEADSATTTGARLTVYLRHTIAQFYIENTTLYNDLSEEALPHIGKTPGNYWISIPVRPEYAGKTVHVTLTPVYANVRDEEPTFMVISRDTLLTMVELPRDGLMLGLGLTAFTAGLFLSLLVFAQPLNGHEKRRIFYLGAVTATAGVWKLSGLPSLLLLLDFLGIHKEIWFAGAVSYLFLLMLSLRVLAVLRTDGRENKRAAACFYLAAALSVVLMLLQMTGILELHQALIWYGVTVAVLHLVSLTGQKPDQMELLWTLPFFLSLGADLLIYLYTDSMHTAPVFLIWCIMNLFMRGFSFFREAILRERELRIKEEELRDAKVKTMMRQIHPHFIYNTLTSIYVLCMDDPKLAMQVIQDFTAYLQANFTALTAPDLIAFPDELRHTKAYVAVESLRYEDKLKVDYEIGHAAFRLPPLTLQPLVENAIKHGLGKGNGQEQIVVRTWAEKERAVIQVEDNGPGFDPDEKKDDEHHIGIENVRDRLRLMCGGTLEVQSRASGGTVITVSIPVQNQQKGALSSG